MKNKQKNKYKISLVHKYETTLFLGDYSRGTFLEGSIEVATKKQAKVIEKTFLQDRRINLFENTGKYIKNSLSDKKSTVDFPKDEFIRTAHLFGDGFTKQYDGYKNIYWLQTNY